MIEVKERGWSAHHISSNDCNFSRNTLIKSKESCVVVSTVGAMKINREYERVNFDSYYETMVFNGVKDRGYIDADIHKPISVDEKLIIEEIDYNSDKEANEFHDKMVEEMVRRLEKYVRVSKCRRGKLR